MIGRCGLMELVNDKCLRCPHALEKYQFALWSNLFLIVLGHIHTFLTKSCIHARKIMTLSTIFFHSPNFAYK